MKRMVDRCNEVYNPKDAYVCVSWKDDEYHPIHYLDGTLVIVGTEKLTNNKYCGPTQFFMRANAYRENSFYGKTMRWVDFARIVADVEQDIKFLIATTDEYPQNIIGEINPHRTSMIENSDGTNIIVLRWDNRDDGDTPKNSAHFLMSKHLSICPLFYTFLERKEFFWISFYHSVIEFRLNQIKAVYMYSSAFIIPPGT